MAMMPVLLSVECPPPLLVLEPVIVDVDEDHDVEADLSAAGDSSFRLIVEVSPLPVVVGDASKTVSPSCIITHS